MGSRSCRGESMDMMKSKKGIFFTYIAVVFMGLLILTVALEQEGSLRSQSFILDTRIRTMDAFTSDVELDISRGVEISGYRALLGLSDYASAGEYVNNVSIDFFELFLHQKHQVIHVQQMLFVKQLFQVFQSY